MNRRSSDNNRGQSPLIGNILLVALAVVLASLIIVIAFGIFDEPVAPAQASVQIDDGERVVMVSGTNVDEVVLRDDQGTVHGRFQTAGDAIALDKLDPRREYSIIAINDGQENLVREITRSELVGDLSAPSSSPAPVSASEVEGDGSASNPYVIRTDSELQAVANTSAGFEVDDHYRLGNDIDASETDQWNGGDGFDPIKNFAGTLEGDGHTILGLTIDRDDENNVGLFADSSGTLSSFSVEDFSIRGGRNVGGIVGDNTGIVEDVSAGYQIEDVYSDAVVGEENVGGLVGTNSNTVRDSSTTGEISGDSSEIAGLVGYNTGSVEASHSSATVTIDSLSGRHVAGLVGTNEGSITDSYATGDVTVMDVTDDYPRVGGLVGENYGAITRSYATGDVLGADSASSENHNYGGLVGINWDGTVSESYATGDVETDGRAGALVGRVSQLNTNGGTSTIVDSYATGNVTSRNDAAGGLVGSVHKPYDLEIDTSFATGTVTAGGPAGGLVGDIESGATVDFTATYWDTETTGQSVSVGSGSADKVDVEGLVTAKMTGSSADGNMDLNFAGVWGTVAGEYPRLQWEN